MNLKVSLAESEHYEIISEFETVFLIDKSTNTEIIIGDFYGDPKGAIIDTNERFVAMYGCGLTVYFLCPPFEAYTYDTKTKQWLEIGRNEPIMWIEKVLQLSDNVIKIILENGKSEIISIGANLSL